MCSSGNTWFHGFHLFLSFCCGHDWLDIVLLPFLEVLEKGDSEQKMMCVYWIDQVLWCLCSAFGAPAVGCVSIYFYLIFTNCLRLLSSLWLGTLVFGYPFYARYVSGSISVYSLQMQLLKKRERKLQVCFSVTMVVIVMHFQSTFLTNAFCWPNTISFHVVRHSLFWLVLLVLVRLWSSGSCCDTHVILRLNYFCIISWLSSHMKFFWLLGTNTSRLFILSLILRWCYCVCMCVCEQWANYNMPFQNVATASLMPHWFIQDWEKELVAFFQSGLPRTSLCLRASVRVCVCVC